MVQKVAQQVKTVDFDMDVSAGSGLGLKNYDFGVTMKTKTTFAGSPGMTTMNLTKQRY